MTDLSLAPAGLEVFHLEATLARPRRNAFGEMRARPALLVRLTDADGCEGWGEAFCNWPAFAASHRARILREILAPLLVGKHFASPTEMWNTLTAQTHRLMLQANEPGPFEQSIAALDIAAWDLAARRASVPLHALLGDADASVPVYASALTKDSAAEIVPELRDDGWRGFKIKVGLGEESDEAALSELRRAAGSDAILMADANQAWTLQEAIEAGDGFQDMVSHG